MGADGATPPRSPKNGWKKGKKYTTCTGNIFLIDEVDTEKKSGELRLHVTRVK